MGTPLRSWACPSYDVTNGRSASSLNAAAKGGNGNHTGNVSTQVSQTHAGGQMGGRGVDYMNRSGSGDPGRNKFGGSKGSL